MSDESVDGAAPNFAGFFEILNCHLKMFPASIDAAHHHLVPQDQLAHEGRPFDVDRAIPTRNAGEYVNSIDP